MTNKIKVHIDTSPLSDGHAVRGVGNYTRNLVDSLEKYHLVELVDANKNPDIVHYPFFDLFINSLPIKKSYPTMVTVHDVIPLVFPQYYPPGIKGKIKLVKQKRSLKGVSAIITDSQTSKEDIVKYLNYPADKIHVVYLSAGENFKVLEKQDQSNSWALAIRRKYHLPEKFVLYVGDVNWNKNIIGLINACKENNQPLVMVGKQTVEENFDRNHIENIPHAELIDKFGRDPDIVRLGWLSEKDLIKLYNLATVFCLPSFYEGFGIQVLEAMACGCPVVTTNLSSPPEIAGKAAVLVDPYSVLSISRGIERLINDDQFRAIMIERGLKQARKFSWEKTAKETVRIYKEILEKY